MFDVDKTKREIHEHSEINPTWRTKVTFGWYKWKSVIRLDMSDNFNNLETPAFLLTEGIGNIMANIRKLMPKSEKDNYNELVKELIEEMKKSLIHYSADAETENR